LGPPERHSAPGTGDFTHPTYFEEIKNDLEETGQGLLFLKDGASSNHFILTAETSHIYTQAGKGRRVHMMIFAPHLKAAEKINLGLDRVGNIRSDGRPIFGFSAKDLVKMVLDIEPECLLVPAHAWTPWFSVFGSHSDSTTWRNASRRKQRTFQRLKPAFPPTRP